MDAVLNWIWQGSMIALVTTLVLALIERSRARDRYMTIWVALLSVLILPVVPHLKDVVFGTTGVEDTSGVGGPLLSMPVAWWTSNTIVVVLWTLWSAATGLRFVAAALSLRRVQRAATPVPWVRHARLSHWVSVATRGRRAELVLSNGVHSAAVLSCGSPVIAIAPALLDQLSDDELDRIVIHEWAHVQRRDDLTNILQSCVRIMAGWHPAVWWLNRQLCVEREIACDELAVAVTGSAKGYAASLVKLAGLPALGAAPLSGLTALGAPSLRRRIHRILSRERGASLRASRLAAAAAGAAMAFLAAGLGDVSAIEAAVVKSAVTISDLSAPVGRVEPNSPLQGPSIVPSRSSSSISHDPQANRPQSQPSRTPADVNPPAAAPRSSDATDTPHVEDIGASRVAGAFSAAPPSVLTSRGSANDPSIVPWRAAAAGGVALGQESRDAAVATAGYFTRLGKRIASSF